MKEPINMSVWTLDRIQREQDKHVTPYAINPIDKNRLDDAIMKDLSVVDSIDNEINAYMRKVQEQSDMYRICEIAKLYIESQRPAEWIPVTERLPEDDEDVLVTYTDSSGHSFIEMVWFDEGKFLSQDGKFELPNVVAWMPLPSPYKEGE